MCLYIPRSNMGHIKKSHLILQIGLEIVTMARAPEHASDETNQ